VHHNASSIAGELTAYISRLSEPKCQYVSEFNILSTHWSSLEISNLQEMATKIQIPLYFDFKQPSEPSIRLRITEGSTAELYFVGNIKSKD
jgi:hypothetical protein